MKQLRDISEWDEAYVHQLPTDEYDWIDYKRTAWLTLDSECLNELSKYASAFANFDGGYLVIGVVEPRNGTPPTFDSALVDLRIRRNLKSWLEDKIPPLTDPPLSRLGIAVVRPSQAPSDTHGVIVIHVPASISAPHQARDHKFYTRLGSKLHPLGSRAILDISSRVRYPTLSAEAHLNLWNTDDANLLIRVTNTSDVFVRHFGVRILCPVSFRGTNLSFEHACIETNDQGQHAWLASRTNGAGAPLFPRDSSRFEFKIRTGGRFKPPLDKTIEALQVRLFADSMPFTDLTFPPEAIANTKRIAAKPELGQPQGGGYSPPAARPSKPTP